ncbi:MAG TPA: peroxiredoxin-like family protein [Anaerolineales bacterium]
MTELEALIENAHRNWAEAWDRGPTRLRWEKTPLQVGDRAPDFKLADGEGKPLRLSSLWRDRPALLLFWRYFGCGCGLLRAERLKQEHPQYLAAGANVVVIGQGEPLRAAAYRQKHEIPCPILCDPGRRAYDAYGLLEGNEAQILFDAPDAMQRRGREAGEEFARARREVGRTPVDSPWQLPGEFVMDAKGVVRLAYRYQYCEDFPNPLVLIAAIRAARGEL